MQVYRLKNNKNDDFDFLIEFWVFGSFGDFCISWHAAEMLSVQRIILTWLCDNFSTQYAHALHKLLYNVSLRTVNTHQPNHRNAVSVILGPFNLGYDDRDEQLYFINSCHCNYTEKNLFVEKLSSLSFCPDVFKQYKCPSTKGPCECAFLQIAFCISFLICSRKQDQLQPCHVIFSSLICISLCLFVMTKFPVQDSLS